LIREKSDLYENLSKTNRELWSETKMYYWLIKSMIYSELGLSIKSGDNDEENRLNDLMMIFENSSLLADIQNKITEKNKIPSRTVWKLISDTSALPDPTVSKNSCDWRGNVKIPLDEVISDIPF